METLKRLIPLICATVVLLVGYWWCASRENSQPVQPQSTTEPTAALQQTEPPTTEPATQPTAESTEPTTQPPTETTTQPPTEPTSPRLSVEQCVVMAPEYPSYEDLFSEDVRYADYEFDWVIADREGGYRYCLLNDMENNLRVRDTALEAEYLVPGSENFREKFGRCQGIGCDGRYAYYCNTEDYRIFTRVFRVDLATGKVETVLEENLRSVSELKANCVLYYIRESGQGAEICRLYIPDRREDVLCAVENDELVYSVTYPETTQGKLSWYGLNPRLVEKAEALWADPDAKKIWNERDYSALWEKAASGEMPPLALSPHEMFFRDLQDEIGILALKRWFFNPTDGSFSSQLGFLDGCWTGSGYPHDHYNPVTEPLPVPKALMEPWQPAPGVKVQGVCEEQRIGEMAYAMSLLVPGREQRQLFWIDNTDVTMVKDVPWEIIGYSSKAIYCLAEGNTVMEVSLDGTVCNMLYVSTEQLADPCCGEGMICFKEGSRIILLDIEKGQYRVAIEDPTLKIENWFSDENWILLGHTRGLYTQQYKFYPETGVLEPTRIL